MLKYQRGLSLSGLLVWGIVIVVVAGTGMKIVPSVIEYTKLLKDSKATVVKVGKDASVADVKTAFSRFAEIDQLDFPLEQLEISKEGGQVIISFDYEKRIPLFTNVSLMINYKGTTAASGKE